MGRSRRSRRGDEETTVDRISDALDRAPAGLHDLAEPTGDVPLEWPSELADVYFAFDGARLFSEAIVLFPAREVDRDGELLVVGEIGGDAIEVDRSGRVWRIDEGTGDRVIDGTAFDRWLHGAIDAEALLYDRDGEFAEDVFDEDGEICEDVEVARLRAQLRRDSRAPAPRWRLARISARRGELDRARAELEEVVANVPDFSWAWLDLARLSEQLGELGGAYDEAVAAAEAAVRRGDDQVAYFWAQAARLAARAGTESDRAQAAARAIAADPGIVRSQIAGAEQNLADGDVSSARGLAELAKAVAPRDLGVIDLLRRIEAVAADESGEDSTN